MAISAALVKELRERTGAGMMECKNALVETDGDFDAAIEHLRKIGQAKAEKKAARTAAQGLMTLRWSADERTAALLEINCETDFVAKEPGFQDLASKVSQIVLDADPANLEALLDLPVEDGGPDVRTAVQDAVAKIGEKIVVNRFVRYHTDDGVLGGYVHGGRIGVLVELEGGSADLAKDIAMHVAASRPVAVSESDVPADVVEKEKDILRHQAQESGKPAEIIEKMIQGRLKKFYAEVTLLGQPFVKDPDQTVEQILEQAKARVRRFERLEVGEDAEQ